MFSIRNLALTATATAVLALLAGCHGDITGAPETPTRPTTAGVPGTEVRPSSGARLPIPPLAPSTVAPDGTRVFTLTAQPGEMTFGGTTGTRTATYGYNGAFLGPTLRATRGERVAVEFTNRLPEPTTLHWHGMHLPAAMDGGPHQVVEPGSTWRPSWQINQPGATLWYHPHPHGRSEGQLYRGLAGLFIIDDADTAAAGLPSTYGVDDIPVIVADKDIDAAGRLTLDHSGNEIGTLGHTITVNGAVDAVLGVTTEKVRLRLLNASTARTYSFGLDDNRPFALVATDGGLLRGPVDLSRIRLSPGERAEIVVTMTPGVQTMLRSYPPDLGAVAVPFAFGGTDTFDVLRLDAAATLAASASISPVLSSFGLRESDATVTRNFELEDRQINGKSMDLNRIDETVIVGTTEIWQVSSRNPYPHNFHIHDVQFEVLTIDGGAPPPELTGRKDTIYLEPHRSYRLIMRFSDYPDPASPYMFHCHLLLHEDEGLMGQFVVVEPGGHAAVPPMAAGDGGQMDHH